MASNNMANVMSDAQGIRLATQRETRGLGERLGEEEEFRVMAVRRMQEAENQLQHYEDNAKQSLPTMHEELNESRKALRNQEELHARTRSELEASRLLPQQGSQQTSSMPISSRTTESSWECIGKDRVPSFPVGTEVREGQLRGSHHTLGRGKCTRAFCAACFFLISGKE